MMDWARDEAIAANVAVHSVRNVDLPTAWPGRTTPRIEVAFTATGRRGTLYGVAHVHPDGDEAAARKELRTVARMLRDTTDLDPDLKVICVGADVDGRRVTMVDMVDWAFRTNDNALRPLPLRFATANGSHGLRLVQQ